MTSRSTETHTRQMTYDQGFLSSATISSSAVWSISRRDYGFSPLCPFFVTDLFPGYVGSLFLLRLILLWSQDNFAASVKAPSWRHTTAHLFANCLLSDSICWLVESTFVFPKLLLSYIAFLHYPGCCRRVQKWKTKMPWHKL